MNTFFNEMTEQSEVKSEITSKYFGAWTRVMTSKSRQKRLAYVDLFAGPGRYEDGTVSTPIKVLQQCIERDDLRERIVTVFNDANEDFANNLENIITEIQGIETLRHQPIVQCSSVGDELVETFEKTKLVPCLAFVDPWGYKGLSSKLIGALIKDWGSDCIFFFNYNRINMGITNKIVIEHMNNIFGEERAEQLRLKVSDCSPEDRELMILNDLAESLSSNRSNFVLPFRFLRPNGMRTSHYLIFVSKHVLGYKIMKDIMWRYSSEHIDGVASFSYIPVGERQLSLLSPYSQPTIEDLMDKLINQFTGKTHTVEALFNLSHVGTPYVLQNYKDAIRRLETEGLVIADPPAQKRRVIKGQISLADKTKITIL